MLSKPTEKIIPDAEIPKQWLWVMSIKPPATCALCASQGHSWGWRRQKGDTRFLCEPCGAKAQVEDEASKSEPKARSVRRQR